MTVSCLAYATGCKQFYDVQSRGVTMAPRKLDVFAGVTFTIIGIGLVAAGIVTGIAKRGFIREAVTAHGMVVSTLSAGSHPDIEFTALSGQKVTYPQGGWLFGYRAGDQVRVFYKPDDPATTACLDAFGALWFTPLFLSILGIALFVIGIWKVSGGRTGTS